MLKKQKIAFRERKRVIDAWVDNDNVTHYGTSLSFGLTIGTMAKSNDSYYYYEIPCLHKNLKLLNK